MTKRLKTSASARKSSIMHLSDINFLAVFVAGIAAFALGFLWYSFFFGKAWQKELGFTDEYIQQGNMPVIFGSSFLMMCIMSFGIALLLANQHLDAASWQIGMHTGLVIGICFVTTSIAINYLYQRRSIKLWLIDASYQVAFLTLIGIIHGLWR